MIKNKLDTMKKLSEIKKVNEDMRSINPDETLTPLIVDIDQKIRESLMEVLQPFSVDEHKEVSSSSNKIQREPLMTFERFINNHNHN